MPAGEVVAIVTGVVACVISVATLLKKPLAQNCSYLKDLKEKLDMLVKKAEELKILIEKVDTEPTSGVRLRGLRMWMNHTEQFLLNIPSFVEQAKDMRHRRCMIELLPNCYWRYTIGKQIAEKIELIDRLLQEGRTYPTVNGLLIRGNIRTTRKLAGLDAEAAVNEMRRVIVFEDIKIIGVCGMGGAGKTEVVAHFSNQILQWNMVFDHVIWVEATRQSNLGMLQMKIARKIDLPLSIDSSVLDNAAMLMEALKKKGRVLLILDDLWRAFSLEEIGIPEFSLPRGRGCKLVITSRFSSLCSQMQSDKKIELRLLSEADACRLFLQELGPNVANASEETRSVMKSVAAECGGLPSAIVAIARYLRKLNGDEDDAEISKAWSKELAALRGSSSSLRVMEESVFARLMPSFERLKLSPHSNIEACFLYCALYPRSHSIEAKELMEYWMWEGLLGNRGWVEEKMTQAEAMLDELKDGGLLESNGCTNGVEHVKMHPIVRDMAIHISKTSPSFFVKAGLGLTKTPPEEMWPEEAERASLMRNDLQEFWYKPNCPNLSTLLLQCNPSNLHFCDGFFQNMPKLKVLDLSYTGVRVLPDSLLSLTNLHALLLHGCKNLTSLPCLAELEALKVLDISCTPITSLPQGTDKLTKLRRLNLSHSCVSNVHPGLLAALRHLEELMMDHCSFFLGSTCLQELVNLRNMVVLEVDFSNTRVFQNYVNSGHWRELKSFKFCIGGSSNIISGNCSLEFVGEFLANGEPSSLPNRTSELHIVRCNHMTQYLAIPAFVNLKVLNVTECWSLKHLLGAQLPNIEEITVKRCENMVSLILIRREGDSAPDDLIRFPRLRKLMLSDMPNLEQSCEATIVCDSLQAICIWNCKKLRRFPVKLQVDGTENKLISPHELREIRGARSWFESLEWNLPDEQAVIEGLFVHESPPDDQLLLCCS